MADQLIRAGEVEIVVAGGMESMTNAPHLLPKSREGFKYGDVTLVDSMAYDALFDQFTSQAMGALTEEYNADGHQPDPRGAGRVRRPLAPEGRRGLEERRLRRRGRAGRDPAAQGRPDRGLAGRGRPRRHHRRVARQAAPRVQQGGHDHRRLRLADLRRRRRGRRDEQGQGRGARPGVAGRDRRARHGRRPRLHAPDAARQRDREGLREGGHRRLRPRPGRVQRGVRRGRHRVRPRARARRGQGQRQRRRDRARPPGRHVRHPHRAAPRAGAEAPRWRRRRGRAVRWRRPGRRPDRPRPEH